MVNGIKENLQDFQLKETKIIQLCKSISQKAQIKKTCFNWEAEVTKEDSVCVAPFWRKIRTKRPGYVFLVCIADYRSSLDYIHPMMNATHARRLFPSRLNGWMVRQPLIQES